MARAPKITARIGEEFHRKVARLKSNLVTDQFAVEAGTAIVTEMKRLIASGRSPVKGWGTFEPYKNPDKYPGKRKPARPVNLSLTGEMLRNLLYKRENNRLSVGILSSAPQKIKVIAGVHNFGEREDIPQRKFIPTDEGLTDSVQKIVREFYRKRVLEILKG